METAILDFIGVIVAVLIAKFAPTLVGDRQYMAKRISRGGYLIAALLFILGCIITAGYLLGHGAARSPS